MAYETVEHFNACAKSTSRKVWKSYNLTKLQAGVLRHCYGKTWTCDECNFSVFSWSLISNEPAGKNRVKKISRKVCYKVIHKTGRFIVFDFTTLYAFLTLERLKPWPWNLAHLRSIVFSSISCLRLVLLSCSQRFKPKWRNQAITTRRTQHHVKTFPSTSVFRPEKESGCY